ncbi:MAG TPA: tetratricopeptide repeat protein [Vicinamibacterales bacterium]|nr:tetratricopeptide repeat protein [Vicinamibacterales bacterium]
MESDQPAPTPGDPVPEPAPAKGAAAAGSVSADAEAAAKKKKKKKDKVRSAWISFAGRIVAQILGAAATVVLGIYVVSNYKGGSDRGGESSTRATRAARAAGGESAVAVLPFDNFSGDASQEYFVDGITEALIADLARTRGLRVISRTSSMYYKGQKKSMPDIAAELGVDLLVEGSVARSGNRVRVTAQLIDGPRDEHIWARTYDHKVDDVLALQSQIATAIAGEVRGVVPGASGQSPSRRAVDPALYELYLRGRHAWNKRTPEALQEARRFFQEAVDKDPNFALAHAGLADTYHLMGPSADMPDAPAKARAAAERAIQLDETLAEAHTSLARLLHRTAGDVDRADIEYRRALELNPGYATAHQWYGTLLAESGRHKEAQEHGERAVALDPLSAAIRQSLALMYFVGRRYDRAAVEARRALDITPELPLARQALARSLLEIGQPREVIAFLTEPAASNPDDLVTLAIAASRTGDPARARAIVTDLSVRQPVPAGPLARWYAASGDTDRALTLLEQVAKETPRMLPQIANDPSFDRVRSSARFKRLMATPTAG